jgi:tetratricopeptide (TPR) repeat protein
MTTKSTRAMLAATLLAASASVAILATPAMAADAPKLSSGVQKHLVEVQDAGKKKDWAAAATALAAAKAVDGRTPFDDYTIARMTIYVDAQTNNLADAAAAAYVAADSTVQPDADKIGNANTAMMLALNEKAYDKAEKYAKAVDASNPTDPGQLSNIGTSYYLGGDFAAAKASAQKRIDAAKAANKLPPRDALGLLLSADVGLKDEVGAEDVLEQQVAAYGDPQDWAQLVDVAITSKGIRDVEAIWLGRLLFLVGGPVSKTDADMVGSIAGHLTFFGDAVNAKAHGGTVDPDPGPRADADKKTIQAQIAGEAKGNGLYNAKLAEALFSYGMYPEAEAAATAAMTKPGDPDASEAPMVLGQALAAEGKYDDALAAFGKVTGGGPATARITRLWVDYVNLKKNPPAVAAPAQASAK